MVATVEDARAVAASGVDVVVAQGSEAGGHRSIVGEAACTDVASVGTPGARASGRGRGVGCRWWRRAASRTGRGLVAALALGAGGRSSSEPGSWRPGTRWRRSSGRSRCSSGRGTTRPSTDAFSGLWLRALRNAYTDGVPGLRARRSCRPCSRRGRPRTWSRRRGGAATETTSSCWRGRESGSSATLPGAAEVVEAVVREARGSSWRDSRGGRAPRELPAGRGRRTPSFSWRAPARWSSRSRRAGCSRLVLRGVALHLDETSSASSWPGSPLGNYLGGTVADLAGTRRTLGLVLATRRDGQPRRSCHSPRSISSP